MQHSRKKKIHEPPTAEETKKQEQRLKSILKMHSSVLQAIQAQVLTPETLELTTKCITLSPDFYSVFNFRRRILQALLQDLEEEAKSQLLSKELDTLTKIIRENSKSYTLWYHRQWVILLCRDFEPLMKKELALCDRMLTADQRNFHVWDYRTWLVKVAKTQTSEEELAYTTTLISRDFSNFSAWHYRSKVVKELYPTVLPADFLKSEFTTLQHAMYTSPGDQSIWTYHQWLLNELIPIQIASVKRTPGGFRLGFTHSVTCPSDQSIVVSNGSEPLSGLWTAVSASEFAYIWDFALSTPSEVLEIRTNQENSSLHDSLGNRKLTKKTIRFVGSLKPEVQGESDNELIRNELRKVEELLGVEDKLRALALLRQAQMYETLSFYCLEPANLTQVLTNIIQAYHDLMTSDSARTVYYQENVSIAEARLSSLSGDVHLSIPKSQHLAAQVLDLVL